MKMSSMGTERTKALLNNVSVFSYDNSHLGCFEPLLLDFYDVPLLRCTLYHE